MSRQNLDEIIAELKNEQPDEQTVRQAAGRVFRSVFDSTYISEQVDRIRGCADFQTLIPAYLSGNLSRARALLLEDHTHQCVECRRALQTARTSDDEGATAWTPPVAKKSYLRSRMLMAALAATLVIGIAIGVTGALNGLLPGQQAIRATVVSVEGTLYRMNDLRSTLVQAGAVIRNAEELRTAKGSRAIFRLVNGAEVEMGERSDLSISRNWTGTSVELERGRLIVQPGRSAQKNLQVTAGDLRIPVRNAVFAVNQGTKGSRVAVAKGFTQIERAEGVTDLRAGQQIATNYRLTNVSLDSEFAWSKNADYYQSLLAEFATLQQQLKSIPSPGVRYSSDLAKYLGPSTVIYAAIPNISGTLTEAKKIFDERLAQSDILRDWWQQQGASRDGKLDSALQQINAVGQFLGDEIVLAVSSRSSHQYTAPVFLAAIQKPGLREYLNANMPANGKPLPVFMNDRIIAASPDARALQEISQSITQANDAGFTGTAFYKRIAQSYSAGAGYLLAVDMEQTVAKTVSRTTGIAPSFDNAQYLLLERHDATSANESDTHASLSFASARHGIASWLGAPGPMGSLDFVSPDANLAVSIIMKNPLTIVNEAISYATQANPATAQNLSNVENQLGVKFGDDLAALFGGDATFALDGPLLPVPSWKVAAEVYDSTHLQQTIQTLITRFNDRQNNASEKLVPGSEVVNGRTFYSVASVRRPNLIVYYTFVDGYLLAGSSKGNLLQAIRNRDASYKLTSSPKFQAQLPADAFTNFSAVIWHNAGDSLRTLAEQMKGSGGSSPSGVPSLAAVLASSGPGLICVYGEPNQIVAATKGDFLGFNLGTLAGIEQGRSLPQLIASRR